MTSHNLRDYSPSSAEKYNEANYSVEREQFNPQDPSEDDDPNHHLHRGLKSRQITMIAIGGAIGTGLIIGTYVFSFFFRNLSLLPCMIRLAKGPKSFC